MLPVRLRKKKTLLPCFGEQVRVGLLSGFVEQTRVLFVMLRENNTLTGFW